MQTIGDEDIPEGWHKGPGGRSYPNNLANAVTPANASGKKKKRQRAPASSSSKRTPASGSPKSPATRSPNSSRIASHQTLVTKRVSARQKSPSGDMIGKAINDFHSKLNTALETY